jgi:hypothetical protein
MAALVAELERPLRRRPRGAVLALAAIGGVAALGAVGWKMTRNQPRAATPPAPPAASAARKWVEKPLTFRGDVIDAALSPDRETLAITAGRDLLTLPVGGGSLRTLVRNVSDHDDSQPTWSLDGKRILLRGSRNQFVDVATGMTTPTELFGYARFISAEEMVTATQPQQRLIFLDAKTQQYRRDCDLTGDYRWIVNVDVAAGSIYVTVRYEDGTSALMVTNSECFLPHVLVPRSDAFKYLALADGRVIALRGPQQVEAQVYDANGVPRGEPQRLPPGSIDVIGVRDDDSFVLQRIVTSWRLFQHDGGASKELARGSMYAQLAFAPDGHRVALVERLPGSEGVLFLADLEAMDDRSHRLLDDVGGIAWSPDGTRLAAVKRGDKRRLVEIDVATGAVRDLGVDDVSVQASVTWLDDRRVAYMRTDHRAYRWIDRVDGTHGDLLDDTKGWTFGLTASRADGTFAVFWNRDKRGLWLVPPRGEPYLARAGDDPSFAWAPDGRTLWIAQGNRLERFDPRTRKLSLVRELTVDPNVSINEVFPIGPDSVLVQMSTSVSDLALWAPE